MNPARVRPPARGQRGSAGALLTAGICLSLAAVFGASAVLIDWFAVARRAEQAAELAALAAVSASVEGSEPCLAAADAARRNASELAGCVVHGSGRSVVVEVSVEARFGHVPPGAPSVVRREATAGTG